jgi:hypothetical protein
VTEAEWLAATDPQLMLDFLRGKASERKGRLYACACARSLIKDASEEEVFSSYGQEWWLVRQSEDSADGRADPPPLLPEWQRGSLLNAAIAGWPAEAANEAARLVFAGNLETPDFWDPYRVPISDQEAERQRLIALSAQEAVRKRQSELLRDLFGNPFRPVPAVDPAWLAWKDGSVPQLAGAAYEERQLPKGTFDPARLALLADALEDAGCADAELLAHLRGPGPHVRGCWVVDLILGKE